MIQEYIIQPYLSEIIENTQFNSLIELIILVILSISFLFTIERGVLWLWLKLSINS